MEKFQTGIHSTVFIDRNIKGSSANTPQVCKHSRTPFRTRVGQFFDKFLSYALFVAAFVFAFLAGAGISSIPAGDKPAGYATKLRIPSTHSTPYAETYTGNYYLLSVKDGKTFYDTLLEGNIIPESIFSNSPTPPQTDTPSGLPEVTYTVTGVPYVQLEDRWVSSGYGFFLAKNMDEFSKPIPSPYERGIPVDELKSFYEKNRETFNENYQSGNGKLLADLTPTTYQEYDMSGFRTQPEQWGKWDIRMIGEVNVKNPIIPRGATNSDSNPLIPMHASSYFYITQSGNLPRPKTPSNLIGRSGDLAYALFYHETITAEDISNGASVGATGVIGSAGEVQPVSGISTKLDAFIREAERDNLHGKKFFFYPKSNESELLQHLKNEKHNNATQDVHEKYTFVPVGNVHEAIGYMKTVNVRPPRS